MHDMNYGCDSKKKPEIVTFAHRNSTFPIYIEIEIYLPSRIPTIYTVQTYTNPFWLYNMFNQIWGIIISGVYMHCVWLSIYSCYIMMIVSNNKFSDFLWSNCFCPFGYYLTTLHWYSNFYWTILLAMVVGFCTFFCSHHLRQTFFFGPKLWPIV